jgi:hypothetical protein
MLFFCFRSGKRPKMNFGLKKNENRAEIEFEK